MPPPPATVSSGVVAVYFSLALLDVEVVANEDKSASDVALNAPRLSVSSLIPKIKPVSDPSPATPAPPPPT